MRRESFLALLIMRYMPALSPRSFLVVLAIVTIGWNVAGVMFSGDWRAWFATDTIPLLVLPPLALTVASFLFAIIGQVGEYQRTGNARALEHMKKPHPRYRVLAYMLFVTYTLLVITAIYMLQTISWE